MDSYSSLSKGYQQLRWKLTLSYSMVTVGALLIVELVILGGLGLLLVLLLNSGLLQAQLIEASSNSYTPTLRFYLAQTPPDLDGIAGWLDQFRAATSTTLPLSFDATDEMFVVSSDGRWLGSRPADLLGSDLVGQLIDPGSVPGLTGPLQAALDGEKDVEKLYTLGQPGDKIVMSVPIWDVGDERVLGALVGIAVVPSLGDLLKEILPILAVSLLVFALIAAIAGTLFGYLAARQPVERLNQLSEASLAWRQGDFSVLVDDPSGDELGHLSHRLNDMALQLEQLLETRRELAVVEERNRLARELHDSVKQQAFAAAAQVSGVRALLKRDPEAADTHLEEAERLIYELRQELTSLILELRPAALGDKGLASAIRDYAAGWGRQNEIVPAVSIWGARSVPLEIEQPLFRIAQEALANVARHSEAKTINIALVYSSGELRLTVSDDGHGFDVEMDHAGYGLRSMQERVDALGGKMTIESLPGKGTTVSCTVPVTESRKNQIEGSHG